jgi:glutamate racemase
MLPKIGWLRAKEPDLQIDTTIPMNDFLSEKDKPIGVFDSGVGGLTVVRALRHRLPHESILYFGDTARVPYGTKSTETIRRFTREITRFLVEQGIKMAVVACNSCSATSLDCVSLEFGGPCLGVIDPGADAAVAATGTGRIGVIGTAATVGSGAYERALAQRLPGARVFSTACPLFVPLAEERMERHEATRIIATEYLRPLLDQEIDTLILGCTHYPLLKETIEEVVGERVRVVDSAESTALAVERTLEERNLARTPESEPLFRYFVSDDPGGLEKMHRRLLPEDPLWVGTARPSLL